MIEDRVRVSARRCMPPVLFDFLRKWNRLTKAWAEGLSRSDKYGSALGIFLPSDNDFAMASQAFLRFSSGAFHESRKETNGGE
jgi:hypothetical protein